MGDWLDEWLTQLPSESVPVHLIPAVRRRLAWERRRERTLQRAGAWLGGIAAALAMVLSGSRLGAQIGLLNPPPLGELGAALQAASASPAQALTDLSARVASWAGALDSWLLLTLALLALPAIYAASRLISLESHQMGGTW
jgi:hypothetical protein